jgi:hypothetical protein
MDLSQTFKTVFPGRTLSIPPTYSITEVTESAGTAVFGVVQFLLSGGMRGETPRSSIDWGAKCYLCGGPAISVRPAQRIIGFRRLNLALRMRTLPGVPTCRDHLAGPLRLIVSVTEWNTKCGHLHVFAEHREFLEDLVARVRARNVVLPPWDTFPRANPFVGWNSGVERAWLEQVWIPYWTHMGLAQRKGLLKCKPPSKTWDGWDKSLTWRFMWER